jgi:hypothetical protein
MEVSMKYPDFTGQGRYEIIVKGHLDGRWSDWFEGMTIVTGCGEDGTPITIFTGHLADQAALHGVLGRIRDINMPLISVNADKKQ